MFKISLDRQLPNGLIPLYVLHNIKNKQPQELIITLLDTANTDIKLLKNTIIGSIARVDNAECIETQLEQQVKPLLSVFLDQSGFQTHAHDNNKSVIQLLDANVPPVIQHKLNTMLNNEFTCIIFRSPTDFRRTNLVEMDLPTTGPPKAKKTIYHIAKIQTLH